MTHKFINSLVHTLTHGTNHNVRKCYARAIKNVGETERSDREPKGFGNTRTSRVQDSSKQGCELGRGLQDSQKLFMEEGADKTSAKPSYRGKASSSRQAKEQVITLLSPLFFNSNFPVIIQALDDICYQINPMLVSVLLH